MHGILGRNRSNYFDVSSCKFGCGEKSLITAGCEWHNRPLFVRKIGVDTVCNAGKEFVETVVENNDSTPRKSSFGGRQVVCCDLGSVASIDADETEWASA